MAPSPLEHQSILAELVSHLGTISRVPAAGTSAPRVDVDADLYEAGYLDSLSVPEFLVLAERSFGVALPDWLIGGHANSLTALATYIEAQLAARASER
jgi:acyl carrier protein